MQMVSQWNFYNGTISDDIHAWIIGGSKQEGTKQGDSHRQYSGRLCSTIIIITVDF